MENIYFPKNNDGVLIIEMTEETTKLSINVLIREGFVVIEATNSVSRIDAEGGKICPGMMKKPSQKLNEPNT